MDPQALGYTVVTFHRRVRVSSFICVPKDGSGKGIVLNINNDIVPQAIGNTLTGVSTDVWYFNDANKSASIRIPL